MKENQKVFVKFCAMTKETEMPYVGYEEVLSMSKCCWKHPS